MTPFRPTSYDRPGEQISTTPSGLKVTSAKRLMVDSMVRMIQKAENHSVEDKLDEDLRQVYLLRNDFLLFVSFLPLNPPLISLQKLLLIQKE